MNVGRYGFYELLAQAALEHLAGNQPEPEDARPLLRAMLTRAFLMLEVAKEHHVWPDGGAVVETGDSFVSWDGVMVCAGNVYVGAMGNSVIAGNTVLRNFREKPGWSSR